MTKIHVLLKKEDLDNQRLKGKVVIVLDILFAITSIVAVLAHRAGKLRARFQRHMHRNCGYLQPLNWQDQSRQYRARPRSRC
jgi:hypothetical protein